MAFVLRSSLTPAQVDGVEILIAVSAVSLTAVVLLLVVLLIAAWRASHHKPSNTVFRSHVTAYLISLLVSDLFQAIGSIVNAKWVNNMAVEVGNFCSVQGAIKQAADVGTALWIVTIAVHTFSVLVLGVHIRRISMYIVLVGGWSFVGAVVTVGPFIIQESSKGPFFGISGFWCWISKPYETEQFVLEYMIMFLSAITSFIMYVLVFLKLRGNLVVVSGGRIRLRSMDQKTPRMVHQVYEPSDLQAHMVSIAKHMLLYPIAYTILIVPIAACRFAEWTGHTVPLGAFIFSDSVFLLSGFVNASLFVFTGRVLPLREIPNIFRASRAKNVSKTCALGSRERMSDEWESETSSAYSLFLASTEKLDLNVEKDLPQLPQETHAVAVNTPHTVSVGRKSPHLF